MLKIFTGLEEIFLSIFSQDPEARKIKKQLKVLQNTLQDLGPGFWNKTTQTVSPAFIQSWFQLYQLILPLNDIFSKTLASPEAKLRDLSSHIVVEAFLGEPFNHTKDMIKYDSFKNLLLSNPDAEKALSAITNDFTQQVSQIKRLNSVEMNLRIDSIYKLKNLTAYNFKSLFKRFGYDLSYIGKQNPIWVPADSSLLISDLLDLYFILGSLDLYTSFEPGIYALLERLGPSKMQENKKKLIKALDKVKKLIMGPCSKQILDTLLKVIKSDPNFSPSVEAPRDQYITLYLEQMTDRFNQNKDRALRDFNESTLQKDIAQLFSGANLLSLTNYSEETNSQLVSADLPTLQSILPFSILKSFATNILAEGYIDSMKKIILDGFFQDKEVASNFSNYVYSCEKTLEQVNQFDEALQQNGKTTLPALEKYLSGKISASSVPIQIIDKINRQAQAFLEEEVNQVVLLTIKALEILNDYKTPQPQIVTNIKTIAGKEHKQFIQNMADGYNKSLQFLRIMKRFVILKGIKL